MKSLGPFVALFFGLLSVLGSVECRAQASSSRSSASAGADSNFSTISDSSFYSRTEHSSQAEVEIDVSGLATAALRRGDLAEARWWLLFALEKRPGDSALQSALDRVDRESGRALIDPQSAAGIRRRLHQMATPAAWLGIAATLSCLAMFFFLGTGRVVCARRRSWRIAALSIALVASLLGVWLGQDLLSDRGELGVVRQGGAVGRSQPLDAAASIGKLEGGDELRIFGRSDRWLEIERAGTRAWVRRDRVHCEELF